MSEIIDFGSLEYDKGVPRPVDGDWAAVTGNDGIPQVVPFNDLRPHHWDDCPCHPFDDGGVLVHNSFDGRENFEQEMRKPS